MHCIVSVGNEQRRTFFSLLPGFFLGGGCAIFFLFSFFFFSFFLFFIGVASAAHCIEFFRKGAQNCMVLPGHDAIRTAGLCLQHRGAAR
jgi:hypothetical protein